MESSTQQTLREEFHENFERKITYNFLEKDGWTLLNDMVNSFRITKKGFSYLVGYQRTGKVKPLKKVNDNLEFIEENSQYYILTYEGPESEMLDKIKPSKDDMNKIKEVIEKNIISRTVNKI